MVEKKKVVRRRSKHIVFFSEPALPRGFNFPLLRFFSASAALEVNLFCSQLLLLL